MRSPISTTPSASRPTARRRTGSRPARLVDRHLQQRHAHVERRLRRDRRRRPQRARRSTTAASTPRRVATVRSRCSAGRSTSSATSSITCPPAWRSSSRPSRRACSSSTTRSSASTCIGDPSANMHFRNNLFLGRDTPGRGILTLRQRHRRLQHGLQRIPPEQGRQGAVPWLGPEDRPATLRAASRRLEDLRDAGRVPRGHRPGDARRRSRFRHLREAGSARSREASRGLSRDGSELRSEAGQQGRRCGCDHPDRERRLHGPRPTSARWKSARRRRSTVRAGSPGSRFTDK